MLVDWVLHMVDIGQYMLHTVKEILDKDGGENPFTDSWDQL